MLQCVSVVNRYLAIANISWSIMLVGFTMPAASNVCNIKNIYIYNIKKYENVCLYTTHTLWSS